MADEMKTGSFSSDVHEGESIEASSNLKSVSNLDKEETSNELNTTEAEINEVRKENARLKIVLEQIRKEYHSLQSRLIDTEQNIQKKNGKASITLESTGEEPELISLCLGQSRADLKGNDNSSNCNSNKSREHELVDSSLELGLSFNFGGSKTDCEELNSKPSPKNSIHETAVEPNKVLKTIRSCDQDELSQQTNGKRARVSVRAKCDTPTMNDGCQWRKYGQKISKGNPCPRAYYRCTVAPSCPVRKQVQRCVDDMSILITTYEGSHNHPLPVSAASMASTTSAAASMLMSGSSSSQQGLGLSAVAMSSTPFYMPNPYSSQPFSTITLDLTSNPSATYPHTNLYSSPLNSNAKFPSTNFNFSSSESNALPTWGSDYVNCGTSPYSNFGRPSQEQFFQPYNPEKKNQELHQGFLTETLTKALTSDPSFQSIITAALSTLVGSGTVNQTKEN